MRFHRAETAFFIFSALILSAALGIFYAWGQVQGAAEALYTPGWVQSVEAVERLLFMIALLLSGTLVYGLFFIFPQIRTQVKEGGELRQMTASLSERSRTLEQAALTDGLTGMQNRRYFDDALREYLGEFGRIDRPVGLMILDLDHFKQVNDTYGHDAGDEVLRSVAKCLKSMTRYHDVVARLGGEEFAIVAPNMDIELLQRFAERMRKAIAGMAIEAGGIQLNVTSSFGIALWDREETAEEFYRRADKQLYEAKRQGRNRVCA